ncbi:sugar transferase [Yoonia sediminilitoris]|uniref:Lipopolysaccharide/colanic/teichoic acid biosynthesis glycosyltransferase n=1 Tax=Yoonia sediminilitoris TaxID=1286148 RepID=A0A2T6KB71_9RHOB|nr:sugar transferase [Yoonia sediminilitoris]PUB12119.1 lipopolysaccharide/colanic/teichoic acid biosynthesis glycosyltransferase [Yoonia sediminilitoris]RCW92946.1 lipopolysaccharide/colanic/teichoic acid biosynthesis glycosyltransferase [Yoonia sediminilitoris]
MLELQAGFLGDEAHDNIWGDAYHRPLSKRCLDYGGAVLLLIILIPVAVVLLVLNRFFNRGPLWFVQDRMGHRCRRFRAIKFRTMTVEQSGHRGAFDGLETDRITALGRILRKMRIDELPQVINVLRGEMSLIGPRPDAYEHAAIYLQTIPGYRERHDVMPGISGLAQTEVGYVDGREGVHRKVAADLRYIADLSLRLELWIVWRTLVIVAMRRGA